MLPAESKNRPIRNGRIQPNTRNDWPWMKKYSTSGNVSNIFLLMLLGSIDCGRRTRTPSVLRIAAGGLPKHHQTVNWRDGDEFCLF
jgi:hypothetical protein